MWSFRTHEQNCREVLALSATNEEDLNQCRADFHHSGRKTTRSTDITVAAQPTTARLRWLSTTDFCTKNSSIDGIPSSIQPKEIHHERHEPKILPLRQLLRRELHLRLPEARRTAILRLWPAVQMWSCLRLPQIVKQAASGTSITSLFRRPTIGAQRA